MHARSLIEWRVHGARFIPPWRGQKEPARRRTHLSTVTNARQSPSPGAVGVEKIRNYVQPFDGDSL